MKNIEKAFLQKSIPIGSGIRLGTDLENNIEGRQDPTTARSQKSENLQQMEKTLAFVQDNGSQSLKELGMLDAAASDDFTKINASLKATEAQLHRTNLMIKNIGQYLANKDIYRQYLNAKNKAAFRESHHAGISLYEAALKFLKGKSGKDKLPTMKMLKEEKSKLTALKNRQYEGYSTMKARHRELQAATHNIRMAIGISPQQVKERNAKNIENQKIGQSI